MPALLCSEDVHVESITAPANFCPNLAFTIKQKLQLQLQEQAQGHRGGNVVPFDLPEICDLITTYLDKFTLSIVVRVCRQWYASWVRHLWKGIRVESGTSKSLDLLNAFPKLSLHIHHLEWIHLSSDSAITTPSLQSVHLSSLNLQSLLLSSWTNDLDATTLSRFVQSSAGRLSVLQLHNIASIRGDLIKVAATLSSLRHFSLAMAGQERTHSRSRHRSNASSSTFSNATSPNSHEQVTAETELTEYTSADQLPALMDACPQLRTIELLDLPSFTLPSFTAANGAAAFSSPPAPDIHESNVHASDKMAAFAQPIQKQWQSMPHLTILNLHATAISGPTLSAVFARCPQLIKLNLGQTSSLYLSGFHLDALLSMNELSILVLSGCHFLDGHGFKEIFKASPNLTTLDIPQTNVDDVALGVLGHQCGKLSDLNMDGCQHITDQGIRDMLSHHLTAKTINTTLLSSLSAQPGPYQNHTLHCLSVSNCTELTGQGVHHILMTCARLKSLEVQQPELMPESLFPHTLETDEDQEDSSASEGASYESTTLYPDTGNDSSDNDTANDEDLELPALSSMPWACHSTLEMLRIKNLNFLNPQQTRFLNARLRELSHLKVLHIGGSQLELSVLNGLGHQLENLYIDDLAREVDLEDVRWLVDHTPNLTRLWCRQLIRHSEPWKLLRGARKHLKLW
ncbi:hypothetical protein EDD11_010605 [Mortierella claussenii]|nr:hypothetical protein EDD11_010605 [Mortierella claussenii]